MQVILLERVEKLGQMGDVVTVKPGFARNYLLPQKKALRATEKNVAYFETEKAQLQAANLERKQEAEQVAAKMAGLTVSIIRSSGDSGQLYGSVNSRDIADGVTEAGFTISRNQVLLDRPIKMLGLHEYRIRLHPEVEVTIVVNVAQSADEAAAQLELGKAIIPSESGDDDEDDTPDLAALVDESVELPDGDSEEASESNEEEESKETN